MDEVELKFLDIDVDMISEKLISIGARKIFDSDLEMFPFLADGFSRSDSSMKLLRVRRIGDDVRITFKGPAESSNMTFREEVEVKVDDYETALVLLEKLGFERGPVFSKHRVHYELGDDVHFEVDTVLGVPTFLEIETQSEKRMVEVCDLLGLDVGDGKKGSIVEIFPDKFKGD